jgi:ketopantoate hydroxymethyltransferase
LVGTVTRHRQVQRLVDLLDLEKFGQLEDAGAFAVECELIPATVMAEINRRIAVTTISLGSGPDADVMFLFSSDICGESAHTPRHAGPTPISPASTSRSARNGSRRSPRFATT